MKTLVVEITSETDAFLEHFGVKGMRWGQRKDRPPAGTNLNATLKGVRLGKDGSIDVAKGANLQRLVRSNGKSLPMKDITYASLSEYDNARYIKVIGGKGFFGGGRDQILSITAIKPIKAPSVDKATELTSELFINNKKFRETFTPMFGVPMSKKDLAKITKDPKGKDAKAWYEAVNTSLTFDKDFDANAPYTQRTVREHMLKNGFNALRDENDVISGIAKAPIIIFNPESSLKVTTITTITDELRGTNKETLAEYRRAGSNWLLENGFE